MLYKNLQKYIFVNFSIYEFLKNLKQQILNLTQAADSSITTLSKSDDFLISIICADTFTNIFYIKFSKTHNIQKSVAYFLPFSIDVSLKNLDTKCMLLWQQSQYSKKQSFWINISLSKLKRFYRLKFF